MGPHLVVSPRPEEDESLQGYLVRLSEANVMTSPRQLLDLTARLAHVRWAHVGDLLASPAALETLERLADLEPGTLRNRGPQQLTTACGPLWRQTDLELPRSCFALDVDQVCPMCLVETPYLRRAWQYNHAPVCLIHRFELVSTCPACEHPLRTLRPALTQCAACGCDLRRATSHPVPEECLPAAAAIQSWKTTRLGTPEFDSPIGPDDVHLLVRLALPVRDGEPRDIGLARGLQQLPVRRRVEALATLGRSWDGRRFDSRALYASFLQRWYYLERFGQPELFLKRWAKASSDLHLHEELRTVLREGRAEATREDAAYLFRGRPPRLTCESDVAAFLGVSSAVATMAAARLNILQRPPEGIGYDADELLEARRFLDGLLDPAAVARIAGFDGAAQALASHRLVEAFGLGYGRDVGYVPDSLADLFDRVAESIEPRNATNSDRSLDEVLGQERPEEVARVIAQVVSGSKTPTGWREPYRLVDLVVAPTPAPALL